MSGGFEVKVWNITVTVSHWHKWKTDKLRGLKYWCEERCCLRVFLHFSCSFVGFWDVSFVLLLAFDRKLAKHIDSMIRECEQLMLWGAAADWHPTQSFQVFARLKWHLHTNDWTNKSHLQFWSMKNCETHCRWSVLFFLLILILNSSSHIHLIFKSASSSSSSSSLSSSSSSSSSASSSSSLSSSFS